MDKLARKGDRKVIDEKKTKKKKGDKCGGWSPGERLD